MDGNGSARKSPRFVNNPAKINNVSHAAAWRMAYGKKLPRDGPPNSPGTTALSESGSTINCNACPATNSHHKLTPRILFKKAKCYACDRELKRGRFVMRCFRCSESSCFSCKAIPRDLNILGLGPRTSSGRSESKKLSDYAPLESPMIPSLIVHCIKEIESRGMEQEGLYETAGDPEIFNFLVGEFLKGNGIPDLSEVTIPTICSTLKHFLRSLSEPVITVELRSDFISAATIFGEQEANRAFHEVIGSLPQANRDTLAYLMIHLQQIAELRKCKMPVSKLAKIFGPTLLAYGTAEMTSLMLQVESANQVSVFQHLMNLSPEYWAHFIDFETLEDRYMDELSQARSKPNEDDFGLSPATSTSDLDDDDVPTSDLLQLRDD